MDFLLSRATYIICRAFSSLALALGLGRARQGAINWVHLRVIRVVPLGYFNKHCCGNAAASPRPRWTQEKRPPTVATTAKRAGSFPSCASSGERGCVARRPRGRPCVDAPSTAPSDCEPTDCEPSCGQPSGSRPGPTTSRRATGRGLAARRGS